MPIARSCAARPAKRGGAGARLQACHSRPSPHARPPRTCGRTALRPPLCRERAAPRVRHISTPALAYGTPRAASVQAGCVILPAHTAPHHPPRPASAGPSKAPARSNGPLHACQSSHLARRAARRVVALHYFACGLPPAPFRSGAWRWRNLRYHSIAYLRLTWLLPYNLSTCDTVDYYSIYLHLDVGRRILLAFS